jgi:hypothetical protein
MPIQFLFRERGLERRRFMAFLDIDRRGRDLTPEDVRLECERLSKMFNLGRWVILSTLRGWLVYFPDSRLSQEELYNVLHQSTLIDPGYLYYVHEKGGIECIRLSEKVVIRGRRRIIEPEPTFIEGGAT